MSSAITPATGCITPRRVQVGTSGYSFRDWVGPFYPSGLPAREHLTYYARHFGCLEVNVTYYRVPDPKLLDGMCQRTPAGFEFIVKLHGDMTHEQSHDDALYQKFTDALVPMQEKARIRGLLAQFPYRFKNTASNRAYLIELRQRFASLSLFVEFRHDSWIVEPMFAFLAQHQIGYVSVDEPGLHGLPAPVARATIDVGYVRLHGRNAKTWYASGPGAGDRYDYLYNATELNEWVTKIRSLVAGVQRVYVFFNNCHGGQAAVNAQAMQDLLAACGL